MPSAGDFGRPSASDSSSDPASGTVKASGSDSSSDDEPLSHRTRMAVRASLKGSPAATDEKKSKVAKDLR